MYLVESFLSVQGEGKYAGYPSLFARFGGCNLKCEGFGCEFVSPLDESHLVGCDSLYAVNEKHFKSQWESYEDAEQLFAKITSHIKDLDYLPHLVITGGEPLIHYKNPIFYGFLELALSQDFSVFFETNATIDVDFEAFGLYKKVGFAMSVKLSNSLEPHKKRINKNAIRHIALNAKEAFFKFVVDEQTVNSGEAQRDIEEITWGVDIPIFCMPLGFNGVEVAKNAPAAVSFCLKNGYNYSDRIHIRLWNEKRGV
ncbi:MAG: 7-carboxy-7-deazaguanine synthase QueE [Campylobacteraceae bacterium]|jgi:organic radical activating enzyme|nr:7-carboxy-7-deazaguanine synthase QueE [Campylobacteraceae bacterium]